MKKLTGLMHLALRSLCCRFVLEQTRKISPFAIRQSSEDCKNGSNNIKLPPEPTTCCMSGCDNCVWIEYAKDLAKLLGGQGDKVREIILSKISDPNLKVFLAVELKSIKNKNSTNGNEK